jgi:polyisoprenoid-binding protein YceI/ketosteroid isomerase-like protein
MTVSSDHETMHKTQRWVIDPARSTVEFRVKNLWGLTTVVGRFSRFDGSYTVCPDGRAVELIVDAESLDTRNRRRDAHLRSSDFFDVESHPHVRFMANDISDAGNGTLRVQGALEAAGKKVPLSFEAAVREVDGQLEVEATTLVDQRLLGMTRSLLGMLRSPSALHVKARLASTAPERPSRRPSNHPRPARQRPDEAAPERLQAIADRFEIEALRGEFTDAGMMREYERFAALFTPDGVWRIPHVSVEFVSRGEIRAGIERLGGLWDYFVQTPHAGTIQLDGDTAVGRSYVAELGHSRDGTSHSNYGVYHDRYQRTPAGWKFAERVYELLYLDSTPLAGSAPDAAGKGRLDSRPESKRRVRSAA